MIAVTNRQRAVPLKVADVRAVVRAVHAAEGAGAPGISVAIVDDATIRELNREWLGHDWATDAIAFDYGDDPSPDDVRGEVVVSAETAAREAAARGLDARGELLLYVAHGVLHLLGWDDDTPARRRAMNARAGEILAGAGLAAAEGGARPSGGASRSGRASKPRPGTRPSRGGRAR
ncbi:MAG: rRNA maturation RNase YbeY [Planctomycetes bacterium]|nr:rRNA maturation RNase YbeY [Planctomycetota bacterium]